jgi:hypothetical protein
MNKLFQLEIKECSYCPCRVHKTYRDEYGFDRDSNYCNKLGYKSGIIGDIQKILDKCPLPDVVFVPAPPPTEVKLFLIYCSTGCTCCSGENHYRGPFSTKEIADARVATYRELRVLASQYSARGNYTIYEHDGEQMTDGRIICGNNVYDKFVDDCTPGGDDEVSPDEA